MRDKKKITLAAKVLSRTAAGGLLFMPPAGCASRIVRDPDYAAILVESGSIAEAVAGTSPVESVAGEALAGAHPVEEYIEAALAQNPEIQGARKRVDAAESRIVQARSLPDPMVGLVVQAEQVQTAAGEQQWSVMAGQNVPWFGKLSRRADAAQAEANQAVADLGAIELAVVEQVKRAYYELYFIQQAIRITETNRKLLVDMANIADSQYRVGRVSQQDVLRAQVEVVNLDSELIRLKQQLNSSQAQLARLLHVSPETELRAQEALAAIELPSALQPLYETAITERPELQAQLAAIERDRQLVELARLAYYPDPTPSATWIQTADHGLSMAANGRDPILLGVQFNAPVYKRRLAAGVREAEARTVADVRRYDSLRDRTLEEVKDLYVRTQSQIELARLFKSEIIPKADQTLQVSLAAYRVGQVDFLQLIDNWQQLLRFQVAYHRLESEARQSLASLERVIGGAANLRASAPPATPEDPNATAKPKD